MLEENQKLLAQVEEEILEGIQTRRSLTKKRVKWTVNGLGEILITTLATGFIIATAIFLMLP